ncbi:MAG: hypothetical protein WCO63_16190 [Bacteroidota bacterium]
MKKLVIFLVLLCVTFMSCAQKIAAPPTDITFWNVWVQHNLIVGMPPHQKKIPQDLIFKSDSGLYGYVTHYQLTLISGGVGPTGPAGPEGPRGDSGYSPVKGIDYFDGVPGPDGPEGPKGDSGVAGSNGTNGANGSIGLNTPWSSVWTMHDYLCNTTPPSGKFCTYTGSYSSWSDFCASLVFSYTDKNSVNWSAMFVGLNDHPTIFRLEKVGDPTNYATFRSEITTEHTTWCRFFSVLVNSNGNPSPNSDYYISFQKNGADGATGSNGTNGSNGSVGPQGPAGPAGLDSTIFVNDHSYTGIKIVLTAAANSVIGDVVYLASSGKATFCKSDAIANCPYAFAICADATIAANASGNWLTNGTIRDDTWSWTVGSPIYVSSTGTTANTLTQTAPSAAHNVVMSVGIALSSHVMYFFGSLIPIELY